MSDKIEENNIDKTDLCSSEGDYIKETVKYERSVCAKPKPRGDAGDSENAIGNIQEILKVREETYKVIGKSRSGGNEEYNELLRFVFGNELDCQYIVRYSYHLGRIKDGEFNGFIIYLDSKNRIRWQTQGGWKDEWTDEERKKYRECVTKVTIAETQPYDLLSEGEKKTFKLILAQGISRCCSRVFDKADEVVEYAMEYVKQRNMEATRFHSLVCASIVALISIIFLLAGSDFICDYSSYKVSKLSFVPFCIAILGSYASIWMRYGELKFTGHSRRLLLYMEVLSRMLVGGLFAYVGLFAYTLFFMKEGTGSDCIQNISFIYNLTFFVAGFSERFVPSLLERFQSEKFAKK